MIKIAIEYLREKLPLNRAVALVTTVVVAPAAAVGGTVTAWLADHLPYVSEQFSAGQITAAFVAGATFTAAALVTMAYKWLEGWQKNEARVHEAAMRGVDGGELEERAADIRRAQADTPGPPPP